jgi:hypothetical protein
MQRYRGRYPASKADQAGAEIAKDNAEKDIALRNSYRALFKGAGGKEDADAVIKDLFAFSMVGKITMTGNSWTYFNEGKRAVGEYIKMMIQEPEEEGG